MPSRGEKRKGESLYVEIDPALHHAWTTLCKQLGLKLNQETAKAIAARLAVLQKSVQGQQGQPGQQPQGKPILR